MGENTVRYDPGELHGPETSYWRRRFIVLLLGLAVFAAGSWGLSEALKLGPVRLSYGSTAAKSGPGSGSGANGNGGAAGSHANGGSNGSGAGNGGETGSPGASGSPAGSPTPAQTSPAVPTPRPSASRQRSGAFKPAFCAQRSIVLSVSASQTTYGSGQVPQFSLSVVSTQKKTCSFNVGSAHLALVIEEGTTRLWSSADCVVGKGSLVTALRRGVPTVVSISWNRRTSSPGCNSPVRVVPPGAYSAHAVDGTVVSAPITFRLG